MCYSKIVNPLLQVEQKLHRPYRRADLGDLAIEENADVNRVLVDGPELAKPINDRRVDIGDTGGMSSQQLVDRNSRHTGVRLVGRSELPPATRTDPTGHITKSGQWERALGS